MTMSEAIPEVPLRIGGRWVSSTRHVDARSPRDGRVVARVCEGDDEQVDAAVGAAATAARTIGEIPARERAAILKRAAVAIRNACEPLARTMAIETGKPVRDGRTEVLRSADTFELAAEEGVRIEGEHVPMDATAPGAGKLGIRLRFPIGVVAAITPFNAPINLTAHKLAPAWAAANAVVLKPSPFSALTTYQFAQVLLDGGIPADWLQIVQGDRAAARLVRAPQVGFVSFTGSSRVGELVRAASGLKPVALELGGNGFTIVAEDAPLAEAADTCGLNAMRLAGQSCISVQNVFVHRSLYDGFVSRLAGRVAALRVGDPLDPDTDVGPVISPASAARIRAMVEAAIADGARPVCGGLGSGRREGSDLPAAPDTPAFASDSAYVRPTVLADVPPDSALVGDEVFGPVIAVMPYDDLQQVFDRINAGRFGLQAGVFTRSLETALRALRALRMGAVIVNGSSTWRSDQAPYGGVKASGLGREGPRFAIREMTEERFVVFNF